MAYKAYITKVKNIRPAENADRLNLCEVFGNTVVVDKSINENDCYLYFPCDGQLSLEFCIANNLLRKLPDGTPSTGYMDPDKRNVKAIKLRGNKSDGIILPLTSLASFGDISTLAVGDTIDVFNGHEICRKYIPKRNQRPTAENRAKRKAKHTIAPTFYEHADTEQLAYNLDAFKACDEVEITLKMHGTSQRTGYHKVFKGMKRTLLDRILFREGTPIYDWDYVSGTRRTVLDSYEGGFYGDNHFREQHANFFEGKLWKGETVYYEVVGFTDTGTPIMAECANKKLNDKEFVKQYGQTTTFSYGCERSVLVCDDTDGRNQRVVGQSDIYVYRMTMTNEDGNVVEYTPDFMRYRCEQMGVKTVPVFWKGDIPEYPATADDDTISPGDWIKNVAERFYDGPDPIGKTHIREGVVCRIINRPKFAAYKYKNFAFKVLEGIIKETAEAPDMEEAEALIEEENV